MASISLVGGVIWREGPKAESFPPGASVVVEGAVVVGVVLRGKRACEWPYATRQFGNPYLPFLCAPRQLEARPLGWTDNDKLVVACLRESGPGSCQEARWQAGGRAGKRARSKPGVRSPCRGSDCPWRQAKPAASSVAVRE